MAKRTNQPGGGIGSRAIAPNCTQYFKGQPSNRVSEKAVSQIGQSLGNHVDGGVAGGKTVRGAAENLYSGSMPRGGPGGVPLGNQTALTAGQGAGSGRTVMPSGGQGMHRSAAGSAKPQGRDILSDFGPDSAAVRNRR
jgi:hypothetical protein